MKDDRLVAHGLRRLDTESARVARTTSNTIDRFGRPT
jgi:hypothetical protein